MLKVRDVMTTEVVSVSPELTLRNAVELFAQRHISGAPVLAGEQLVGVVSASDLLSFESSTPVVPTETGEDVNLLEPPEEWQEGDEAPGAYFADWWDDAGAEVLERIEQVKTPEWDLLSEHAVSEVMSRSICAIHPDADLVYAAGFMVRAGVHRLVVLEGRQLKGILTSMDVVRAVAQRRVTLG